MYEVKNERMIEYIKAIDQMKKMFEEIVLEQITRKDNERADEIAKLASSPYQWKYKEVMFQVELAQCRRVGTEEIWDGNWMKEIYDYLLSGSLPNDQAERENDSLRSLEPFYTKSLIHVPFALLGSGGG